ncbi:thioesterase II family protein [Xenorhabdus sp. PB62.4]|uniref:thioesterase II family protein n=1 Tax=Xenorhabdus sp. PB62.4 TaxID=1851573 RepID=UPI0016572727|nr:alpha/beta fold hydrolase [Xenorhabdus sp. PB62.4]MBC8954646.1 PvdG [Xenorhabdus sp. PB62.4]
MSTSHAWAGLSRHSQNEQMKMVVFPFAGGNATAFHSWLRDLPGHDWLSLDILQLPGRADRASEALLTDFNEIVEDIFPDLVRLASERPLLMMGYSMGACLAYELTLRLEQRCGVSPVGLLLAARKAPAFHSVTEGRRHFDQERMRQEVRQLGGTPEAVLRNPEVFEHFYKVLSADFQALESYRPALNSMVQAPIAVIGGIDDPETDIGQLYAWQRHTHSSFDLHMLKGGHFFIQTEKQALLRLLHHYAVIFKDRF